MATRLYFRTYTKQLSARSFASTRPPQVLLSAMCRRPYMTHTCKNSARMTDIAGVAQRWGLLASLDAALRVCFATVIMPEGHILLPNFTTLGLSQFQLRANPNCRRATENAISAIERSGMLSEDEICDLPRRQFGLLASLCHPTCDLTQLQLIIRFLVSFEYRWVKRQRPLGWDWWKDEKE